MTTVIWHSRDRTKVYKPEKGNREMLGIYLLPWLVLLLLMLLGAIVSTRTFVHLLKRNHAPEMFDTTSFRRGFLRQLQEEKLLFKETMSAQEPL